MLMREEFDDVARAARNEIGLMEAAGHDRAAIIAADYLHELEGLPSRKFQALNDALRTMGRGMGVQIDDRLAERVVGVLGKLAYQASIPFRAALVMRNYLQTAFFTAPVVGPRAWKFGLAAVNPATRK